METINQRIKKIIDLKKITPYEFSKKLGDKRPDAIYNLIKNDNTNPSPKTLNKIKETFTDINYSWLLTGNGNVFNELKSQFEPTNSSPVAEQSSTSELTIPVYDVEFSAGFGSFFNEHIDIITHLPKAMFKNAENFIIAKGDSMEDKIHSRDWVGIKKINDFSVIPYGNIFGIETLELGYIKYIRKSQKENHFLIRSENPNYDDFDLPFDKIINLYIITDVIPFSQTLHLI